MTAMMLTDQPGTPRARRDKPLSLRALDGAAVFWFAVTLIGQWAFFYYLMAFYGPMAVTGNLRGAWRLCARWAQRLCRRRHRGQR